MKFGLYFFIPAILFFTSCKGQNENKNTLQTREKKIVLQLEKYDAGFFSVQKPKGWLVITGGRCSTFGIFMYDPSEPLRQIFYFGELGPVYVNKQQKQIDYNYMAMGGYRVQWYEMPVVNPLTPSNFLSTLPKILQTNIARQYMTRLPTLKSPEIISRTQNNPLAFGRGELIRALFTDNRKHVGEGLFLINVAQVLPYTGGPGASLAFGFIVIGVTAPEGEFIDLQPQLVKSVQSFTLTQNYVNQCLAESQKQWENVLKAGKTLSEASDIITKGWEERNKTYDIISEKRSDAILGKERLYDPSTNQVYEVDNGFFEKYDLNRNKFEMNNLKLLTGDNYNLWMQSPLYGSKYIK